MNDSLRSRIAAVLWQIYAPLMGYADQRWDELSEALRDEWREDADAVIAALGRRTCQRCRLAVPLDGFPMPHEGSDVMRSYCWGCTNYVAWATS